MEHRTYYAVFLNTHFHVFMTFEQTLHVSTSPHPAALCAHGRSVLVGPRLVGGAVWQ